MKDWGSAGKVAGSGEQIAGEEPWKVRIEKLQKARETELGLREICEPPLLAEFKEELLVSSCC